MTARRGRAGTVPSRVRLRVGHVFAVPLDEDRIGYGQIVHSSGHGNYFFALFERPYQRNEKPDLRTVVNDRLALLALSLDALLYHEHWQLVGHCAVDSTRVPWPAYKEAISPGRFQVVDHAGKRRRTATAAEAEELPFRTVVAPIVVENAYKALHGLAGWDDAYDKLRPVPDNQRSDHLLSR